MTRSIEADYSERYLFPPAIEDWVGEDHPARFVREVVETLDLKEAGFDREGDQRGGQQQGRPHYSDKLLLKAWLYGYMNGIRSQRELEKACRENVGLIWLLGRYEPDHNTLWRFWRRNREALKGMFRQVVGIGLEAGLIELVLHAVDGTKIQSQSSSRRSKVLYRKNIGEALRRVDRQIQEMDQEMECQAGEGGQGYRLPAGLVEAGALRQKLQAAKARLDKAGVNQLNPVEPEARMMPCEGKKRLAYNAQTVVDAGSGMIVAEEVVSEAVDSRQLLPMVEQAEHNLGQTAADTVADKGYRTDEAIGQAAERQYSVLVQLYETEGERAQAYHGSRFRYDGEQDCCYCPRGEKLVFKGLRRSRHGWMQRRYQCEVSKNCPEAGLCNPGSRGRQIFIGPYREAVDRQRRLQSQEQNRSKLQRRKTIVEPVFGHIKQNMGFRRWTFGSLAGVQAQWAMLCTAYNLKKLLRLWQTGTFQLAT